VVDVDRGALCPLEQYAVAGLPASVEEVTTVDRHLVFEQSIANREQVLVERVDVEGVGVFGVVDVEAVHSGGDGTVV